jgi:anti-sigma regulatory factor (Ser/Thr protein kinase)
VDVRREFPALSSSLPAIREATAACARETAAADAVVAAAVQAVHEAAANVVVHAYGGGTADATIELRSRNGDGWLRFTVGDRGRGFRPGRATPGYGLGMAIMAQLADELQMRDRDGRGLLIEVAFRLQPV